jgi:hypothetical protein
MKETEVFDCCSAIKLDVLRRAIEFFFKIMRGSGIEHRAPRIRNANKWTVTSGEISEMSVGTPDN